MNKFLEDTKKHFLSVENMVDTSSVRERAIIFATLIVLILIGSFALLLEPSIKNISKLNKELITKKQEIKEQETTKKIMEIEYSIDPDVRNKKRIKELKN